MSGERAGMLAGIRDRALRLLPRPVWDAVGVALLGVIAPLIGLSGMWDFLRVTPEPVSGWWSVAFLLPGCVLMALRERMPMVALLGGLVLFLGDLLTAGGLGPLLVLMDVLWNAVRSGSRRRREIIGAGIGAVTVGVVAATLARTGDVRVTFLMGLTLAALLGTDYWWAVAVGRAEDVAELESSRAADRAREAIRDDRELMARELHDVVAGHVSAIAIRAEAALSTPPDRDGDREALRAVRDASLNAHEALRSMISVLRDTDGRFSLSLRLADVPALVEAGKESGLRVRYVSELTGDVDAVIEDTATAVVREALSNCNRHTPGAEVEVRLAGDAESVSVSIESSAGSARPRRALTGSGTGLATLADGIGRLRGDFRAGPRPGGWSVAATLPRRVGS
ncbi:sensor histidine kinase [Microbacterium soli]|uniref:sensor histidine kinase n=1 Tax=Microbacterium soli TaxID=446075 RepID=UPI0031D276F6